jgi:hypothetical protein
MASGCVRSASGFVVGACPAGHAGAHRVDLGRAHRALDQLQRGRPVHAHAALGGVHRLGQTKTLIPKLLAKPERRVPVDGGAGVPGIPFAQGVADDMGGGKGGPGQGNARRARDKGGAGQAVGLKPGVLGGELKHRGASAGQVEDKDAVDAALGRGNEGGSDAFVVGVVLIGGKRAQSVKSTVKPCM